MSTAENQDIDFLFPVYEPKSFVWTAKHKYPRTTHNVDYRDWTSCPVLEGRSPYKYTRRSVWPLLPYERFMPLHPDLSEEKAAQIRLEMDNPKGRKTPAEAIHIGYRKYSLDPTLKKLRHFNDPIPSPLHTTKRESYVDPNDRKDLMYKLDTRRFAYTPHSVAIGIVPCTLVSEYEPVKDTSWSKDYVYTPKVYANNKKKGCKG